MTFFIAEDLIIQFGIAWKLKHNRPHHFWIFMCKNMAMINESWEFSKLVQRHMKVCITTNFIFIIRWFSPSNPKYWNCLSIYTTSIFPTLVVWLTGFTSKIFNILICSIILFCNFQLLTIEIGENFFYINTTDIILIFFRLQINFCQIEVEFFS